MVNHINNYNCNNNLLEDRYLYNQVARCICGYNKLLLSYSGGLDSTVLLDILTNLVRCSNPLINTTNPFFLRAVYVNHGFSTNSISWANHCATQCKIRNIPFHIIHINDHLFFQKERNIEANARILRYQKLCEYLNPEETLLTAHHMDDQVETVLLALKRGSGPAGLSGIHKNIMLCNNNYRLLRPLLKCSRSQLEAYAYRKQLIWIEDDTNCNTHFDRNFLRIQIIPLLKKRWPAFNLVISRTAQLCKNQESLLKELLYKSLKKLIDLDGALFYYPLLQYSAVKRHALLRYWLSNYLINMPSYRLLNRVYREVILSKSDAYPVLRLGKYICSRFRRKLYILPIEMISVINSISLPWNIFHGTMLLPHKLGFLISQKVTIKTDEYCFQKVLKFQIHSSMLLSIFWDYFKIPGKVLTDCLVRSPKIHEKVSIRFGHVQGLLYIANRNRGRKLKKIWQELGIPPWLRTRIPLLFYNNTLIAAIGVFITKDGNINNTVNVLIHKNTCVVWRVLWIQDISYYTVFKNTIRYFLI